MFFQKYNLVDELLPIFFPQLQDGNIYEKFKDYFKTLTTLEVETCSRSEKGMRELREEATQVRSLVAKV